MKLSISKIQEFEKCKYSYFLTHIKKEKTDVVPIQLKEGVEKHEMFEKAITNTKERKYAISIVGIENEMKLLSNYAKYKQDADNFVQFSRDLLFSGNDPLPLHTELKLFNEPLNISGVIDRVDQEDDKTLILDYKTGKVHPIYEFYFQLATYVFMYEEQYNVPVTHWGIFFTNSGSWEIEAIDRMEVAKAKARIQLTREMIKKAEAENSFPKQPSVLCKWCTWMQAGKCNGK